MRKHDLSPWTCVRFRVHATRDYLQHADVERACASVWPGHATEMKNDWNDAKLTYRICSKHKHTHLNDSNKTIRLHSRAFGASHCSCNQASAHKRHPSQPQAFHPENCVSVSGNAMQIEWACGHVLIWEKKKTVYCLRWSASPAIKRFTPKCYCWRKYLWNWIVDNSQLTIYLDLNAYHYYFQIRVEMNWMFFHKFLLKICTSNLNYGTTSALLLLRHYITNTTPTLKTEPTWTAEHRFWAVRRKNASQSRHWKQLWFWGEKTKFLDNKIIVRKSAYFASPPLNLFWRSFIYFGDGWTLHVSIRCLSYS